MKRDAQGYRVAVVGASSLLGKELLTVLEERGFPVARLITLGPGEEEPELPIVDLDGNLAAKDQAQAVFEQAPGGLVQGAGPPQSGSRMRI